MNRSLRSLAAIVLVLCSTSLVIDQARGGLAGPQTARFVTFNASLNRNNSGDLLSDLDNPTATGVDQSVADRIQQIHNVAEVLQRIDADVVLINEFDFDLAGTPTASQTPAGLGYSSESAARFQGNFLSTSHGGGATGRTTTDPVVYSYRYTPNTNTGVPSGLDLDRSGSVGGGNDALGFGNFPGQFGLTIYSKYEITEVRTFQTFLWKDMPGALLPDDDGTPEPGDYYSSEILDILPLSSKNHVDVTVNINGQDVHFLTAHPTPPVFDGAEDRNGRRNHDEIRFWADYIAGESYIYDDDGAFGGLAEGALFVIAGDYNADPFDGDSTDDAILQFLNNPLINNSVVPESAGAADPIHQNGSNPSHEGPPAQDTADFADGSPGNLRVDMVLPSANLAIEDSGVFWPAPNDPNFGLAGTFGNPGLWSGFPTSDHKAVWVDVQVVPEPTAAVLLALAGIGAAVCGRRR